MDKLKSDDDRDAKNNTGTGTIIRTSSSDGSMLAIKSSCVGALAAAIGKLSLSSDSALVVWAFNLCSVYIASGTSAGIGTGGNNKGNSIVCYSTSIGIRVVGLFVMLLLNAYMMKYFLDALRRSSTAVVTLTTSSVNFAFSVRK